MSHEAMERAFSDVPNGLGELGNTRQYLLNIAKKPREAIAGILVAVLPTPDYDRVALVITSSRIIQVTQEGAIQAWPYADMSSLAVIGGEEKLFGRDFMWLRGELSASRTLNWLLPNVYYEHSTHVGRLAEDAFRRTQKTGSSNRRLRRRRRLCHFSGGGVVLDTVVPRGR